MELRRHRRRPVPQSAEGDNDAYYASMSRKSAVVKWAFIIMIPVFLVVMLSVYHSSITYDNLTYLLRDFQSETNVISSDFADVSFDTQSSLDAAVFRGELAVVGSSNVSLYNSAGSKTFDYRSEMANPAVISTGKYMLAYDVGGTKYSIYTNLSRVLDAEEDSVIENASMAQNGAFLITKRARDAKYVVSLYDSNFRNRANYKRPRFVADAAISPSGKNIVIVSISNSGASLATNVEMYGFADEKPFASYDGIGFLPIGLSYFEDGSFALICDSRIIFFDKDGSVKTTYYNDNGRLSCSFSKGSSLLAAYSGSVTGFATELIIFDSAGNIIYNIKTAQKISDVAYSDEYVFALGADSAFRFSRADKNVKKEQCGADAKRIVAADSFAIVVSGNGASSVFGEDPKTE